jgi:hypothetical protein
VKGLDCFLHASGRVNVRARRAFPKLACDPGLSSGYTTGSSELQRLAKAKVWDIPGPSRIDAMPGKKGRRVGVELEDNLVALGHTQRS